MVLAEDAAGDVRVSTGTQQEETTKCSAKE